MNVGLLILGLVLFVMLVVVHELGHFLVARRNGVDIEEFGIFFPPRLWSHKTKKGWDFSINLLPLGGFVRLKGEYDSAKGKGTYGASKLGVKTKILLAGVGMNLLAAFVIFTVMAWVGLPNILDNQFKVSGDTKVINDVHNKDKVDIGMVVKGSPAARAHIANGSQVIYIAGSQITSVDQAAAITKSHAGEKVNIVTEKNGKRSDVGVQLNKKSPNLGVEFDSEETGEQLRRSTWSAPVVSVGLIGQFTALTFQGLGHALAGLGGIIAGAFTGNHSAREHAQTQASSQVAGPVGIFKILKNGTLIGYQFILFFIGYISLALAIMNVLPIPALDGGKLFMTLIARALRKKLTENVELIVNGVGFALLMTMLIFITIVDVKR